MKYFAFSGKLIERSILKKAKQLPYSYHLELAMSMLLSLTESWL